MRSLYKTHICSYGAMCPLRSYVNNVLLLRSIKFTLNDPSCRILDILMIRRIIDDVPGSTRNYLYPYFRFLS